MPLGMRGDRPGRIERHITRAVVQKTVMDTVDVLIIADDVWPEKAGGLREDAAGGIERGESAAAVEKTVVSPVVSWYSPTTLLEEMAVAVD